MLGRNAKACFRENTIALSIANNVNSFISFIY